LGNVLSHNQIISFIKINSNDLKDETAICFAESLKKYII